MRRLSTLIGNNDKLVGPDPLIETVCHNLEDCDEFSAFFSNDKIKIEEASKKQIAAIFTEIDVKEKNTEIAYVQTKMADKLYYSINSTLIYSNETKLDIILCENNQEAHMLYSLLSNMSIPSAIISENYVNVGLGLEKHNNNDIFDYHYLFPLFNKMTENNMVIAIIAIDKLDFIETKEFKEKTLEINIERNKKSEIEHLKRAISIATNYTTIGVEEIVSQCKNIKTPYDIRYENKYIIDPTRDLELASKYEYTITCSEDKKWLEDLEKVANDIIIVSRKKPKIDCYASYKGLKKALSEFDEALLLGPEFLL